MTEVDIRRPHVVSAWSLSKKPAIRIADEVIDVTSGSLLDWPDTTPGTANWLPPSEYLRRLADEPAEYIVAVTGTSSAYFVTAHGLTSDRPPIDYEMLRLEAAAQSGNEQAFVAAYHSMEWSGRTSDDYIKAIQWALAAGTYLAARHLAAKGAERYPDHAELQKYAHVLAPPTVIRRGLPPDPSLRANRDWLMRRSDQFRGRWVALRNGELLGSAPSLQSLTQQIGDTKGILLTKVY